MLHLICSEADEEGRFKRRNYRQLQREGFYTDLRVNSKMLISQIDNKKRAVGCLLILF